jgi:hypothetical protein
VTQRRRRHASYCNGATSTKEDFMSDINVLLIVATEATSADQTLSQVSSATSSDGVTVNVFDSLGDLPAYCALASDLNGCLQLFTVGNDGTLWHMRQTAPNGDWSGWWSHDAPSGVKFERIRPAVASGADGRPELFVVDNDENLWHMRQEAPTGDWSPWSCREAPDTDIGDRIEKGVRQ